MFTNGIVVFVDGERVSQVGKCFNYGTSQSSWTASTFWFANELQYYNEDGEPFRDWEILGTALGINVVFRKLKNISKNRIDSQSISQDFPISKRSAIFIIVL